MHQWECRVTADDYDKTCRKLCSKITLTSSLKDYNNKSGIKAKLAMVLTCKADFPLYVLAVMIWFWIRTVYSCSSCPPPGRMLRSVLRGTLMARRSPYLRILYYCMSAEMAIPTTISVHPINSFPLPMLAQHSSGREKFEYPRLQGRGRSTNKLVSVIWTGKAQHTYWLPWISVNVPPVIVVSLEFEKIPVDDANGEESDNACRFI